MGLSLRRTETPSRTHDARKTDAADRTHRVLETRSHWVWPYWLEQQANPASPSFVSSAPLGLRANVANRRWTSLASVGRPSDATIDPRGLITPRPGGWSLDWWIGAEDRWHFPSRDVAVRQELFEGTPVVVTRVRVPGGDLIQRAMAVQGPPSVGGGAMAAVDIMNDSRVPVAIALAVRPADVTGVASVEHIELRRDVLFVNGEPALLLPTTPRQVAFGDHTLDLADAVVAERTDRQLSFEVSCRQGLAQAALVFPLTHQTQLRLGLPIEAIAGEPPEEGGAVLALFPPVDRVASGWRSHAAVGMAATLPAGTVAESFDAVRQQLLGFAAAPGAVTKESTQLLAALARLGRTDEALRWFGEWLDGVSLDGGFEGSRTHPAANGRAFHALGQNSLRSPDADNFAPYVGAVAKGAHWIEKRARRGSVSAGVHDEWVSGLAMAARLMHDLGQTEAGELISERLQRVLEVCGGGADCHGDSDVSALDVSGSLSDAPVAGSAGFDVRAVIRSAQQALCAGDVPACWSSLTWLLECATPTWTWPQVLSPRSGEGSDGSGHDVEVSARLVALVCDMLVRQLEPLVTAVADRTWLDRPIHLALAAGVGPDWYGQNIEVHRMPTEAGLVSYALRWHGERPALLWEIEPRAGSAPQAANRGVHITSPWLDPNWSSNERTGEALLAQPPTPPAPEVEIEAPVEPEPPKEPAAEVTVKIKKPKLPKPPIDPKNNPTTSFT